MMNDATGPAVTSFQGQTRGASARLRKVLNGICLTQVDAKSAAYAVAHVQAESAFVQSYRAGWTQARAAQASGASSLIQTHAPQQFCRLVVLLPLDNLAAAPRLGG